MKNSKVLYLLIAGAFLATFFSCGMGLKTDMTDREKESRDYIDQRVNEIEEGLSTREIVFEPNEPGDELELTMGSLTALDACAEQITESTFKTTAVSDDCVPQIIIDDPEPEPTCPAGQKLECVFIENEVDSSDFTINDSMARISDGYYSCHCIEVEVPPTDQEQCLSDGGSWVTDSCIAWDDGSIVNEEIEIATAMNSISDLDGGTQVCVEWSYKCEMPEPEPTPEELCEADGLHIYECSTVPIDDPIDNEDLAVSTSYARLTDTTNYTVVCECNEIPVEPEPEIVGDINDDGSFDIGDLVYMLNVLQGLESVSLEQMRKGNVNEEGLNVLDAMDLSVALNYLFKGLAYDSEGNLKALPMNILSGDVSGEGVVDDIDLLLIDWYAKGYITLDKKALTACDVNIDGNGSEINCDMTDFDLILDHIYYGNPVERLPFVDLKVFSLDDPVVISDPCIGIEQYTDESLAAKLADYCL